MKLWKRLPLVLLLGMGIMVFGIGCAGDDEEEPPPPPEGQLALVAHTLNFGETITEQQLTISNAGDASLTWSISGASIPYWVTANPTGGTLTADGQTQITIRVHRVGVGPGTTTAVLMFLTDYNDDSLTVTVGRTCDLLGDDFNSGSAAGWTATALDVSQNDDGYVVLGPNSAIEAGRLMQNVAPIMPCVISARLRRSTQTATYKQYGLLLQGATTGNALYFTVYVDNDTNYTVEQSVGGNWEVLHAGLTSLISTNMGDWNILRLELYEQNQTTYARGYAGTADQFLFEDVELSSAITFAKMGIRSEEYTVHADWFCSARQ